jgi:hypothetical protein
MAQSRGFPLADTLDDGDAMNNDCHSESMPAEAANSAVVGLKAAKKTSNAKHKKGESSLAPKGVSKSIEADAKSATSATRADVKCAYSSPLVQFKSYRFSPYYRTKAGESLAAPKHRHGPMLDCPGGRGPSIAVVFCRQAFSYIFSYKFTARHHTILFHCPPSHQHVWP